MKNITVSHRLQTWLSIRLFAVVCLSILFQISAIKGVIAIPLVSITTVHSDGCGTNVCCLHFVVTIPANESLKHFNILIPPGTATGTPEDCWNLGCASTNSVINSTTSTSGTVSDHEQVDWTLNVAGPATFEFMLCPVDPPCSQFANWTVLNWTQVWNDGSNHTDGPHSITLPPSCNTNDQCPHCDQINVYNGSCYDIICLTQHWPSAARGTFNIHFSPALNTTYPCTPNGGCSLTVPTPEDPGWTFTAVPGTGGADWTLTTGSLTGCQTTCIDIPKCGTTTLRTVSVTDDTGPCNTSDQGTFKIGYLPIPEESKSIQNYPNPLSRASQFRTVIPFEIANDGDARITILDASGRIIHNEVQNFAGAGKHFFYFTGEQLAAGKYFYTIQSPLGAVIVRRSLLIVK